MTKTSLVKGTAVLAAAGLFVKFLGAFFRIPLANMIGAVGMANYAPAYSLYNVLLVFSTAGVPVAVSKMVSERHAAGRYAEADRVFQLSRLLMLVTGMLGFGIVFLYAEEISELFHVPGASLSMRAMAPALLLVPLVASYRGYFQGMNNMVPTAVSQITEQIFRRGGRTGAGHVSEGQRVDLQRVYVAAAGRGRRLLRRGCRRSGRAFGYRNVIFDCTAAAEGAHQARPDPAVQFFFLILKRILAIALPITLGAAIMPIVGLIDAGVVAARLQASGWEKEVAEDLYGQLTGFAAPLIGFPQILIQSVVVSLVPLGSCCKAEEGRLSATGDAGDGLSDRYDPGDTLCSWFDRSGAAGSFTSAVSNPEGQCHPCSPVSAASGAGIFRAGRCPGFHRSAAGDRQTDGSGKESADRCGGQVRPHVEFDGGACCQYQGRGAGE